MPTLSKMKKRFFSLTGTLIGLLAGTILAAPAAAISFNFSGAMEDGRAIEGSYSLDENIFREAAQAPPYTFEAENPLDFFSLTIGGQNIFTGTPSSSVLHNIIVSNASPLVFKHIYINVPEVSFTLGLDAPAEKCLVQECRGVVAYFRDIPSEGSPFGNINQTPAKAETVPEPTVAIALVLVGGLMLRKNQITSAS